jgi:hypothetical protein
VFGPVEGDELDPGASQKVDDTSQPAVDSGGVGDQPDLFSLDDVETAFQQDLDSELDAAGGCGHFTFFAPAGKKRNRQATEDRAG